MEVSVNPSDPHGRTPVDRPIYKGRMDHIRFVEKYATNPMPTITEGEDALQRAAIGGKVHIVESLIDRMKSSPQKQADAYALLGAYFADCKFDMQQAMVLWVKSLNIQIQNSLQVIENSTYHVAAEIWDMDSLVSITNDEVAILMQSLALRERILGRKHMYTCLAILRCCDYYFDIHQYRHFVELRKYAILHSLTIRWRDRIKLLIDLFRVMIVIDHTSIGLKDVTEIINLVFDLMYHMYCLRVESIFRDVVYLLRMAYELAKTDEEKAELKQFTHILLQKDYRTDSGGCILHVAADIPLYDEIYTNYPYCELPSADTLHTLVKAGANLHTIDDDGNTALHIAVFGLQRLLHSGRHQDHAMNSTILRIIHLLLYHGSDIDSVNYRNQRPIDDLREQIKVFDYIKLQCLAARAVRENQLEYRGVVPSRIVEFLDRH